MAKERRKLVGVEFEVARRVARDLSERLEDACDVLQVAGEVRRERSVCKRLLFVAVPRQVPADLVGERLQPAPWPVLSSLVTEGILLAQPWRGKRLRGDKVRTYAINRTFTQPGVLDLEVDLVEEDQFPIALALKTGGDMFSVALVTSQLRQGYLPPGYVCRNHRLYRVVDEDGEKVPHPVSSEREFLELCSCGWIDPVFRTF